MSLVAGRPSTYGRCPARRSVQSCRVSTSTQGSGSTWPESSTPAKCPRRTTSSLGRMAPPPQRSRGACATCRSRRRKCDETHPACLACRSRGVVCGGYETQLRWGTGIASRGQFTGASAPLEDAISQRPKGRRRDLLKAGRRAALGREPDLSTIHAGRTGKTLASRAGESIVLVAGL